MRHLFCCLLLVCAGVAGAQVEPPEPLPLPDLDLDLLQAGPAWLAGDHVKARQHFQAAALRGHALGQYNLAMMLLHGEGGPRDAAQATQLLQQAAGAGIGLAHEALAQMQPRAAALKSATRTLPCASPTRARSTPAVGPLQPARAL